MKPVLIRKYHNRKLYIRKGETEPVGYVSLQGIIDILNKGKDVVVVDEISGLDITAETLTACLAYVTLDVDTLVGLLRRE